MVCTVKEFEAPSVTNIEHLQNQDSHSAIAMARSLTTTSLMEDRNDVFLTLGKLSLTHITGTIADYLLISLGSSSGKTLFCNAANTRPQTTWDSLATYSNEVVGEMIRISQFEKNETLSLSLYVGGEFVAQTNIPVWHGNKVWSGKRTVNFSRDNDIIANLNISVDFVGNDYNTDVAIEKILHWRVVYDAHGVDELIPTLEKFKVIDSTEFVKRFHEILDALLEMLSSFVKSDRSDLLLNIFYALVNTLEKVTARSKDYLYLANDYMTNRFNFAGLSECLLILIDQAIQIDTTPGRDHDMLDRLFKVSDYLSQLIAASAAIDSDRGREAQQITISIVRKYLRRVTDSIKVVLSRASQEFFDLQMAIVQNVFYFYANVRNFVPPDDLLQMMIEMTDSIRTDNDKLNTQRLLLIKKISNSWHYNQSQYRPLITAYTIKWTLPFWLDPREFNQERKDQIRLLSGIFAAQFNILWPVRNKEVEVCKRYGQLLPLGAKLYNELLSQFESQGKMRSRKVFSPLFPDSYPFETRPIDSLVHDAVFDETLIELGIVLTLLVNISHFSGQQVIDSTLSTSQYSELAFNVIQACNAMLHSVSFPKTWISLLAVHHETVLGSLDYLSVLMKSRFIPPPEQAEEFNSGLWFAFLTCLLHLASSEAIAVEHLPEQKRKTVWKISGDIRGRAATLLQEMWDEIGWNATDEDRNRFGQEIFGGFQVQMFGGETSLVRDVLNLCLVRHPAAQKAAVHVLQSMIVSEWTLNEDLTGLQREIIASLDDIFQSRAFLPEEYDKISFSQLLRAAFHIDPEDEAYPYINALLEDVDEFLDLLLDLYNVPPGDAYNDDRIFHALNVLNFLKDIDRVEIFSRYVNDIAEWNRSKLQFVQTGLALRLLASAYDWSYDQKLPASDHPSFPAQTGFERKEALYEDIVQSFSRGKSFENAIDSVKELIQAYGTISFDFKKMANATRILAKLYDSVDTVERLAPQYFRVAYIGVGFPRSLRNRLFIFEGNAWEKLESIHERLHKTYPGATIVSTESAAKQDGQYLFVSTVEPEASNKHHFFSTIRPTPGAKDYQSRLDLRCFSFSRPLPGNTSPLDLWVEKTTYETYQAFPTIVKRSEVKSVTVVKLSPLENAMNILQAKTNDLIDLESAFNSGNSDQTNASRLDLVLSGAVDSPVNGGIQVYRAFLEDESLRNDANTSILVASLENAFLDYAGAIQRCLAIHSRVVPATLRPLHQSLVELFHRNFAPELATLGEGISYEDQLRAGLVMRRTSISPNVGYKQHLMSGREGANSAQSEYMEEVESSANLDSLLGNAIAASDSMIRGTDLRRDNRSPNSDASKRSTLILKQGRTGSPRAMFN